jgi:four helix bundle protein
VAIKSYRELEAVYVVTRAWPDRERFGLISQSPRSACSIAYNIAEGNGRLYRREYVKHLSYARGSLFELETQLILATRTGISEAAPLRPIWTLAQRVGQMLNRLISALMRMDLDAPLTESTARRPRSSSTSQIKGCPDTSPRSRTRLHRTPGPGPRTPTP